MLADIQWNDIIEFGRIKDVISAYARFYNKYCEIYDVFQCRRKYFLGKNVQNNHGLLRHSLTLSPRKAEKPASPTVTNAIKAEIPACRSLIYSRKAEILAWKLRKKLLKITSVSYTHLTLPTNREV